jgi:hypothetical protein
MEFRPESFHLHNWIHLKQAVGDNYLDTRRWSISGGFSDPKGLSFDNRVVGVTL